MQRIFKIALALTAVLAPVGTMATAVRADDVARQAQSDVSKASNTVNDLQALGREIAARQRNEGGGTAVSASNATLKQASDTNTTRTTKAKKAKKGGGKKKKKSP